MKHEIEIPDLPEGYRATSYTLPIHYDDLVLTSHGIEKAGHVDMTAPFLIVEKIKPRRRVFECVSEELRCAVMGEWYEPRCGDLILSTKPITQDKYIIWREVKEES